MHIDGTMAKCTSGRAARGGGRATPARITTSRRWESTPHDTA